MSLRGFSFDASGCSLLKTGRSGDLPPLSWTLSAVPALSFPWRPFSGSPPPSKAKAGSSVWFSSTYFPEIAWQFYQVFELVSSAHCAAQNVWPTEGPFPSHHVVATFILSPIQETLEGPELNVFYHRLPRRWQMVDRNFIFQKQPPYAYPVNIPAMESEDRSKPYGDTGTAREEQAPRKPQNTHHRGVFRAILQGNLYHWGGFFLMMSLLKSFPATVREEEGEREEKKERKGQVRRGCFSERAPKRSLILRCCNCVGPNSSLCLCENEHCGIIITVSAAKLASLMAKTCF